MFSLAAETFFITISGVLAPGPLFFALISQGHRSGAKAGLGFAVAHTLIELPLVVMLALGFLTLASQPMAKVITEIAGGLIIILFGGLTIRGGLTKKSDQPNSAGNMNRNPLILGLIFTGLNLYFIIWWTTVGMKLIADSILFASITGVFAMFAFHIWMDYVWLIGISHLAKRGAAVIGTKGYKILIIVAGIVLIYFGLTSLLSGLSAFSG